jgi:SAM-dependent methyltransferase
MTSPMTSPMTTATTNGTGTGTPAYALDQSWYAERDRLTSLTALYDEGTVDLAVRLGLGPGWRCADVGAGTGTVARLFAERVGPGGRVLAVDVDIRFLEPLATGVVEVAQADLTVTALPHGSFDLVHARLLLEHLPVRDRLLRELAAAVRPGGWLLVEDFDWVTAGLVDPPSAVHEKVSGAVRAVFSRHGYDAQYGRRLPRAMAAVGLRDVVTRTDARQVDADPATGVPQWELLVDQLAPAMLATGLVTPTDLDAFGALCHDGDTVMFAPLMVSTAGRRPGPTRRAAGGDE